MNLLLLSAEDFCAPDLVRISGRRHRHLLEILQAGPGRQVRAGLLNGKLGSAEIVAQTPEQTTLSVALTEPPPAPAPLTLLLALPRPKAFRRLLQGVTAFGIKRIVLLNTARVDKSYWQSPFLAQDALHEQLLLGLEQARDTILPEVLLCPRFRPFVEDQLPRLAADTLRLAAHPAGSQPCPSAVADAVTLAIGPEGGFVPFEVELLTAQGFTAVHLGARPLRVETAISALLGRLLRL
jgi:RsmE family RNA methyltransferase